MSDEPKHQTSRAGVIFVMIAVGGSAIGVGGWHLLSNRGAGLDTTGFDMSSTPDPAQAPRRPSLPASPLPAEEPQTSLGMVKGDAGLRVAGPGAAPSKASGAPGAAATPSSPKEAAVQAFKEAALKNEKIVAAFIRRMQAKHPSIAQYGKEWAASPELRALRDQYWKDKDPLKFAAGMTNSKDFGRLLKKFAGDPGIRDTLMTGIKEAPPGLLGAVGGVFQNDKVAKGLVTTVTQALGLPASLTGFLDGSDAKPPDQNKVMADIMGSADLKKAMNNQPAPVALDPKDADKAKEQAPNGFTPLGGR